MTAAEYQAMLREQAEKKEPKHHNRYVYVFEDGFVTNEKAASGHGKLLEKYDSEKEYRRMKELKLLARAGKITELVRQKRLLVKEGFVSAEGKKERPIWYCADFLYQENGQTVVEDVKGIDKETGRPQTTEAFRLKWKLLKARYPEYVFRIY